MIQSVNSHENISGSRLSHSSLSLFSPSTHVCFLLYDSNASSFFLYLYFEKLWEAKISLYFHVVAKREEKEKKQEKLLNVIFFKLEVWLGWIFILNAKEPLLHLLSFFSLFAASILPSK